MPKRLALFICYAAIFLLNALPAYSENGIKLLRDDEIENVLHDLSRPIFSAAKIKEREIEFILLNDIQENAFVIGGKAIFINSGLLISNINSPEAIVGIIAHELGHLLAKHNIIKQIQLADTSKNVMYGSILGLAAMTAGIPEIGTFLSLGAYNSGYLTMMKYSRQHESEADKISSNLLTKAGIGTNGLLKFLNSLRDRERQISFSPYYLTHPLSKERVAFLRNYARADNQFYSNEFVNRYKRAIYKLIAFTTNRVTLFTAQAINNRENLDYANSIILFRQGKLTRSIELLDRLLTIEPENPYFLEFKGQVELSAGKMQEAVDDFARAYSINSQNGLIAIEYAFSLIKYAEKTQAHGKKTELLNKAIDVLGKNLNIIEDDVISLNLLSNACFLNGMKGESKLYQAERLYIIGANGKAKHEVNKAIELLKPGSTTYIKAQDLKKLLD